MPNRLAESTSPYLLQHADNPVDWYPWGAEAFAEAARRDRPVLLSVGYSSCHWCHVMAHESFEDPATARTMNELFVNVKVDREERPDVDAIYMNAVQALTGRGGWPMTVWLTPDAEPFYAGTYYPAEDRHGMPSFRRVMAAVADAWDHRRAGVAEQATNLAGAIDRYLPATDEAPATAQFTGAYQAYLAAFDRDEGGLGGAPKFPQEPTIEYLVRVADEPWAPEARSMAFATLEAMANGGLQDHLGGGFFRYAVDGRWRIPHFEKMLYTNAQLARLYLRAWQLGAPDSFRDTAERTLDYIAADLTDPAGGWYAAEDADSEGVEGKFYVFDVDEFRAAAGEDAGVAAAIFGVTDAGNFEGANHLYLARSVSDVAAAHGSEPDDVAAATDRATRQLLKVRSRRVRPGLDDKVITAWNGLALRSFAEAGAVLNEPRYLDAARANAEFVLSELVVDGRLRRSWAKGTVSSVGGFLDDYAAYAVGLFTLYMATGEVRWYRAAEDLTRSIPDLFSGPAGLHQTAADAERLITRPKDQMDNPLPSGSSLAAEALLWLSLYTGDGDLAGLAEQTIREGGRLIESYPTAVGHLLAVAHASQDTQELAIVGPESAELAAVFWSRYRPATVLAWDRRGTDGEVVPLLSGRWTGETLGYVCRSFVCERPVETPDALRELLGS